MKNSLFTMALVGLLVAPGAGPLRGQNSDHKAALEAIRMFFEGLTTQDTALMASVLEDGARLVQTLTVEGQPTIRTVPMKEFVDRIGGHEGEALLERYWAPEIRIEDNLAAVWLEYAFYVGDRLDHCGEDHFQLARTTEGWKIIAIADTQRSSGCSDPPEE